MGGVAGGGEQRAQKNTTWEGTLSEFDIVRGLIDFARNFITPRYPHFRFLLLNESNSTYDFWRQPEGEIGSAKLTEAVSARSIDLAISVSLFTHLDYALALEMLASVHQVLKNDGRVFLTLFILDSDALKDMEQNRSILSFKHRTSTGKLYAEKGDDPTFAVAYDNDLLNELLRNAGFRLDRRVRGYWAIGEPGETFQDIMVLRKGHAQT